MDLDLLDKIKRLTVKAMISDDSLMETLVLKGGNAISLSHGIGNRGSRDLDFSMEEDFKDLEEVKGKIESSLKETFAEEKLHAFDIKFLERPKGMDQDLKSFWGGYKIEFKVTDEKHLNDYKDNIDRLRATALDLSGGANKGKSFPIDISRHEYCDEVKEEKEIDGMTYYAYPPQLIVFEKVRAICQQMPEYKDVIGTKSGKSRAKDFYDIYTLLENWDIDIDSDESKETLRKVFEAKRVPTSYLSQMASQREFHRASFPSVEDTVVVKESLQSFDYYFDFVVGKFGHLTL